MDGQDLQDFLVGFGMPDCVGRMVKDAGMMAGKSLGIGNCLVHSRGNSLPGMVGLGYAVSHVPN